MASKVWFPIDLPMTDDAVREGVDALLEYRTDAQRGNPPGKAEAAYAAVLATTIMRELLSPFARQLGIEELLDEPGNRSIERARQLMAICLRRGLPIFDLHLEWELADALEALNSGQTAPILQRKVGRRGAAPYEIARAELDLLKWIRHQHGLGRKVAEAEAEVANAVRCTVAAIQKWPGEIAKVLPSEEVYSELRLAEEVGRREAAGESLRDDSYKSYDLLRVWGTLKRDLGAIVTRRRAAIIGCHGANVAR